MLALMKMSVYNWANFVAAVIAIVVTAWEIIRWSKRSIASSIASELNSLRREVTANGKDTPSLGDTAARTEEKLDQVIKTLNHLDEEIDEVKEQLMRHLGWHEGVRKNPFV